MPEPPHVSIITRYLFENPWPIAIALVLVGLIAGWTGMRDGIINRMRLAAAMIGLALLAIFAGYMVTTPGEHGRIVTESLVKAFVVGDVVSVDSLLAKEATLVIGSPTN